jgi:hypothetical protein
MTELDKLSDTLLEQAKRFLEKAEEKNIENDAKSAFLNASLLICISGLEAHINSIIDEMVTPVTFTILEQSTLKEKGIGFKNGRYTLNSTLKISRLTEKLEIIFFRFKNVGYRKETWWGELKNGIILRNKLVHPKEEYSLNEEDVKRTIRSVISCINALYLCVYGSKFHDKNLDLQSKLYF